MKRTIQAVAAAGLLAFTSTPDVSAANAPTVTVVGFAPAEPDQESGSIVTIGNYVYALSPTAEALEGTIWSMNKTTGTSSNVYTFTGGTDGDLPRGGLTAFNGMLYGTAVGGGTGPSGGEGTVWKYNPTANTLATLFSFAGGLTNGNAPEATVITADGTNFYGTTAGNTTSRGTAYRISYNGSTGHMVWGDALNTANGYAPQYSGMCFDPARRGYVYMNAQEGGANGYGSVIRFSITNGNQTLIHSYNTTDGYGPETTPAIMPGDTNHVYVTTPSGTGGIIAQIDVSTPSYTYTVLSQTLNYRYGNMAAGPDGALYAVAFNVAAGGGVFQRIDSSGTVTTVANMINFTNDLQMPIGMTYDTNDGVFYYFQKIKNTVYRVSIPMPTLITHQTGGTNGTVIQFTAVQGQTYSLEYYTNIPPWKMAATITATNSSGSITDTVQRADAIYAVVQPLTTSYSNIVKNAKLIPPPPKPIYDGNYGGYPTVVFVTCTNCAADTNGPIPPADLAPPAPDLSARH